MNNPNKDFEELIENLPVGIASIDTQGFITYLSNPAKVLLGVTSDDVVGFHIKNFMPQEMSAAYLSRFTNIIKGSEIQSREYKLKRMDGSLIWLELNAHLIFNQKKEITGLNIIINDISKIKRTQTELIENQRQLATLLSNLPGIVYRCKNDDNWTALFVSDGCYELTGFKADDFTTFKISFFSLTHIDDRIKVKNAIDAAINKKEKYEITYRLITKNSTTKWVREIGQGVFAHDGSLVSLEGFILDVTDRVNFMNDLNESHERYKSLVDNMHDGLTFRDINGNILFANNKLYSIFGIDPTDLESMERSNFISDENKATIQSSVNRILQKESEIESIEYEAKKKDGTNIWLESVVVPTVNKDNAIIGFQTITRDITLRKTIEQELIKSEARLKLLFNSAKDSIFILQEDIIVEANEATLLMFGYSHEDIVGHSVIEFSPKYQSSGEESSELARQYVARALKESSLSFEWLHKKKNNQLFYTEVSLNCITIYGQVFLQAIVRDITQRKEAELAIQKSEEMYRKLVSTVPDVIIRTDLDGNIVFINEGSIPFLRYYPSEKLLGKNILGFISSSDKERASQNLVSILKENIGIQEYKMEFADNTILYCEVNGNVIRDNSDNPIELVFIVRDVTEKKRIEEASKISSENFKRIFDLAPYAMVITLIGDNPIILDVNQAYENIYGKKRSEVIGHRSTPMLDPAIEKEILDEFIRTGMVNDFEVEILERNGKKIIVQLASRIIEYDNKPCTLTVLKDISDQKLAEEKVLTLLQRLNDIIELIPDATFILDKDNIVISWNKAMEELSGVKKEDVLGKGNYAHSFALYNERRPILIDLLDINHNPSEKLYEYIIRDGNKIYGEAYDSKISNGKGAYLWGVAAPLFDKNGVRFGSIEVIRDITVLKQREHELSKYKDRLEELIKERTKQLENVNQLLEKEIVKQKKSEEKVKFALEKEKELNELKTRFISIASHEFRTPLTTIYSSVQLLEKYGRNWDEAMYNSQFARIKEYVHYMTKIMDDVLTISRADSGKIRFEPKVTDLKVLCKSMVDDVKIIMTNKHKFEFSYKTRDKNFNIDEKLLKYILLNLLSNAVKYSPNGGKIAFEVGKVKDNLQFVISDEGLGIPLSDQKDLFEPFHRGINVSDIQGTGLGMSIIKKSVDLHSGDIYFESQEGKGTKFTVIFPVKSNE